MIEVPMKKKIQIRMLIEYSVIEEPSSENNEDLMKMIPK
jgi:hypothetical protein